MLKGLKPLALTAIEKFPKKHLFFQLILCLIKIGKIINKALFGVFFILSKPSPNSEAISRQ
ncbi:hypothetical protein AX282_21340 [Bacillus spizizenii]|nr:hypothetical protein AX282_21340 [Bacillus spizizenii]